MPSIPRIENGEGLIRTYDLLESLQDDIYISYRELEGNKNSQYLRRCVVRAVFSYIEAVVECIKVELRSSIRLGEYTGALTEKEIELLGSISILGIKNGKFIPLDNNIKRTFKLASKVWGLEFKLDTNRENFRDFVAAKKARNRLTHPRTYYDIQVTDRDMHCHSVSSIWVKNEFQRLFKERVLSLTSKIPSEFIEGLVGKN